MFKLAANRIIKNEALGNQAYYSPAGSVDCQQLLNRSCLFWPHHRQTPTDRQKPLYSPVITISQTRNGWKLKSTYGSYGQIRDGGRRSNWKWLNRYNLARTDCTIVLKFDRLVNQGSVYATKAENDGRPQGSSGSASSIASQFSCYKLLTKSSRIASRPVIKHESYFLAYFLAMSRIQHFQHKLFCVNYTNFNTIGKSSGVVPIGSPANVTRACLHQVIWETVLQCIWALSERRINDVIYRY